MKRDSPKGWKYKGLLLVAFLLIPVCVLAQEVYRYERIWPALQQPWYFDPPEDIAISSSGDVYVADRGNHRIQKFNAAGQFITTWGTEGSGDGQFRTLNGIAIDSRGDVYVVDASSEKAHSIQKFTADGQFITTWGSRGSDEGQFESPGTIAIDGSDNVYVTDTYSHRIQKFTAEGQFITTWGMEGSGAGQFDRPEGIAIDGSGNVYVADTNNHRIQKFTAEGLFITTWGNLGFVDDGQFCLPHKIVIDSRGNVYVADNRIQKFTADGQFITTWGSSGSGEGQFSSPLAIAIDSRGNVYVAEGIDARILKYTAEGQFMTAWGSRGTGDGQFLSPRGIAIDSNGDVYVLDDFDGRIQKFTAEGQFITTWGRGSGDGGFWFPRGIAIDSNGDVYVADTLNDCVKKFTAEGQFITKWGSAGSDPGSLNSPSGIALTAKGKVYVSDTNNDRIQVFTPTTVFGDKAIIVAGGGPFKGNHIWDVTQVNANGAFKSLKDQGFAKESVYYLTADTDLDLDGNGLLDDVDADATNEALRKAITEWAIDAHDVVVYLVDHGGEQTFRMSEREILAAVDLDRWLDTLQQRISGKVVVIYDACESGSFVSRMTPPPGKQRIVITSTSPGEDARILNDGTISFSRFFWGEVRQGANVYDSFLIARDGVNYAPPGQEPLVDANGNGVGNEKLNQELARDYTIGNGIKLAGGTAPFVDEVSPDQVLNGETSATIWAEDVVTTGRVSRVWAVIKPPTVQACSPDIPVTSLPTLELRKSEEDGRYEGTYKAFSVTGAHTVAVYASDDDGLVSLPTETVVHQTRGTPLPDLKVNGSDGHFGIASSEPVSVTLALAAGRHGGADSDGWVAAHTTPFGWFTFDIETGGWLPGLDLTVGYQGPLADRAAEEILALPGLPEGRYTIYSVVDRTRNGVIDQAFSYDCLTVSSEAR
jgi:DNA-binding beta-propeller fold protein YncE